MTGEQQPQQEVTMEAIVAQIYKLDMHITTLKNMIEVINTKMARMSHNLDAYFAHRGFVPPPYQSLPYLRFVSRALCRGLLDRLVILVVLSSL